MKGLPLEGTYNLLHIARSQPQSVQTFEGPTAPASNWAFLAFTLQTHYLPLLNSECSYATSGILSLSLARPMSGGHGGCTPHNLHSGTDLLSKLLSMATHPISLPCHCHCQPTADLLAVLCAQIFQCSIYNTPVTFCVSHCKAGLPPVLCLNCAHCHQCQPTTTFIAVNSSTVEPVSA